MISRADKQQLEEQGYLLVTNLVPEPLCAAVRATICQHLRFREHEPATWPVRPGHGVINIFHPQSLWDVRQHPAVHEAFAALHGTDALWVGTDRVSFKVRDEEHAEPGPAEPIHWDGDPRRYRTRSLQGLLYLTDTSPDQGAFCCVPEIYREIDRFLADHPEAAETRRPAVGPRRIETVAGPAGSMVIWDRRLPHSSTFNLTPNPRWVQYVAMDPAGDEAARRERADEFRSKMPPGWALRQRVPGQKIPEPGPLPRLTPLGRRLAGIDPW